MKKLSKSIQRVDSMWFCYGIQKVQDDPRQFPRPQKKGPFQCQQVPIKTRAPRDSSVCASPRAYGKVRKPLLIKKARMTKTSRKEIHKNKSKRNCSQRLREDPKKKKSPLRHDATSPKVMVQSCYRGKKGDLDFVL